MTSEELLDSYYQGFARKSGWDSVLDDNFEFVGGHNMTNPAPTTAGRCIPCLFSPLGLGASS